MTLSIVLFVAFSWPAIAELPNQLPDPDGQPPATNKPVKVYILSGQSNMVGIGQITGRGTRWKNISNPTVSVYSGKYSSDIDYDKVPPIEVKQLETYGGVKPTPFPGGGVQIARGELEIETSGIYKFKPGYQASTYNIMELDGVEVHRREPGKDPTYQLFKVEAGKKYPFKITFLTNAANGLGWWVRTDIPGTLETVVKVDKKFPYLLKDNGEWTVRNDTLYRGVITATGNGPLTPGVQGGTIGPELGFGHVMGYYHDEPVLIIKSAQGNRSLGWDFLPPGSERFEHDGKIYAGYQDPQGSWEKGAIPKQGNWYAGKQYDDCFEAVHKILDNFGKEYPQFKDQGYEIAGFVWWQGHKDGGGVYADRYEQNLVHLIKTLRKEFDAPNVPFVIGTIGFGGWKLKGPHLTVANAQLAVSGETGNYPEFAGNVLTVETRDFWRDAEQSPKNQDYHYNQNAETYMLVGEALGRGMVKLLEAR